jgi:ribosome modulation factor
MIAVLVDKAWERGFKAGEKFIKECPYSEDTPEARNWFDGWNEGAAKAMGFPYSETYDEKIQGVKHHYCAFNY